MRHDKLTPRHPARDPWAPRELCDGSLGVRGSCTRSSAANAATHTLRHDSRHAARGGPQLLALACRAQRHIHSLQTRGHDAVRDAVGHGPPIRYRSGHRIHDGGYAPPNHSPDRHTSARGNAPAH